MVTVTVQLDPAVAGFYQHIASAARLPLETVLADTLFKLAGELSLEALQRSRDTYSGSDVHLSFLDTPLGSTMD